MIIAINRRNDLLEKQNKTKIKPSSGFRLLMDQT